MSSMLGIIRLSTPTLLLLFILFIDSYPAHAAVVNIESEKIFQSKVLDSPSAWFVMFYSKETLDPLDDLADKVSVYGINVAVVDCSAKSNQRFCASSGIKTVPSIRFYSDIPVKNPYTKKFFRSPSIYNGNPDMKSVESFISKSLITIPKISSAKGIEDILKGSDDALAVLFTEKDTITMHYKSIAYPFRGTTLKFAQASKTSNEVATQFNITTFPAFGVYNRQTMTYTPFLGNLKNRTEVIAWCESFAAVASASSDGDSIDTDTQSDDEVTTSLSQSLSVTEDSFKSTILEREGFAWVVAVVDASSYTNRTTKRTLASVARKCEGVIRFVLLNCSDSNADSAPSTIEEKSDASEPSRSKPSEAVHLCSSDTSTKPLLAIVPYSADQRRKFSSAPLKWVYSIQDHDSALKRAGESLPDNRVALLNEAVVSTFLSSGTMMRILSVIALTDKEVPRSIPIMLRNLALSFAAPAPLKGKRTEFELAEEVDWGVGLGIAQVGLVSKPSREVLRSFGNPDMTLPALVVVGASAESLEAGKQKSDGAVDMSAVQYDPAISGPMRYSSVKAFVMHVYGSMGLPVPEHITAAQKLREKESGAAVSKKASSSGSTTESVDQVVEEAVPEVVEEPDPDVLEMMAEIKREEEERARKLQEELEMEKQQRLEEEKKAKAAKVKAAKKSKKKKSSSSGGTAKEL